MLKTQNGRLLAIEKLSQDDVITIIASINPDLAKAMRFVKNDLDCAFYKASYRFGDRIINDGKCYLPLQDGGSIAFNDLDLSDKLRNDLNYSENEDPLGLVLSKNSEFYLMGKDGIQTQSIIHPGQIFGVPKAIDDVSNISTSVLELNLNAGSRSLFMLSKISDNIDHVKIQEHYGTILSAPSTPQDHWELFVDIANKSNSPWRCEIIYFSRSWIHQLKSDEWAAITKRLTALHRSSYSIWHNVAATWNKTFYEIEQDKKLAKYYSMPSINMAKHLFMLAGGIAHGFKPATNEGAAPINLIIEAYTNVYNKLAKQNYSPIIMEATKFDNHSKHPIYYSINYSTSTQNDLEASGHKSQIARLEEIRRVEENYTRTILEEKSNVQSLYDIADKTEFSYYHINPENYDKIQNAALIATTDKRFINSENEKFPGTSTFFRGCIKISHKN